MNEPRVLPVLPPEILRSFDRGEEGEPTICPVCREDVPDTRRRDSTYCSDRCARRAEAARLRAHRTRYSRLWRARKKAGRGT